MLADNALIEIVVLLTRYSVHTVLKYVFLFLDGSRWKKNSILIQILNFFGIGTTRVGRFDEFRVKDSIIIHGCWLFYRLQNNIISKIIMMHRKSSTTLVVAK